jgi:hypothetical protein
MLDESNRLMAQIKNATKLKEIKRAKRKYYYTLIKKWTIRVSLFVFITSAVFFPVETGTIVGTWIHDFFGTVYKNISK